jgi:hypothetical protein
MPSLSFPVSVSAFALLFAASMFGGVASGDIDFIRTHGTAWSMTLLASPAMYLFVVRFRRAELNGWWLCFWGLGWLTNLIHFYFGLFHLHDGEPQTVFERQGFLLAFSIFFFTGLWGLDVVAALLRILRPQSWVARVAPEFGWLDCVASGVGFLTFFISTVLFRNDETSLVVGLIMTAAVAVALFRRIWFSTGVEVPS